MKMKYENIIKQMTLAEKARMMSGKNTWETVDFEKYGIPSMTMSDGPHGLRRQAGAGDHLGLNASLPATCFPTAAAYVRGIQSKGIAACPKHFAANSPEPPNGSGRAVCS